MQFTNDYDLIGNPRLTRARDAIAAYAITKGEDGEPVEDVAVDLMTDLLQFLTAEGLDAWALALRAQGHEEAEREEIGESLRLFANHKPPLWQGEFDASFDVPAAIRNLVDADFLTDESWHNDVMPSFSIWGVTEPDLRIWVDHPDTKEREMGPGGKRFLVVECLPDSTEHARHLETDDVEEAIATIIAWYNEHNPETPLTRPAGPA